MFNDVKLKTPLPCAKCGARLSEWQTKSMSYAGYDLANTLQRLKLNSRMSGEIHTVCDSCSLYVSRTVTKGHVDESGSP